MRDWLKNIRFDVINVRFRSRQSGIARCHWLPGKCWLKVNQSKQKQREKWHKSKFFLFRVTLKKKKDFLTLQCHFKETITLTLGGKRISGKIQATPK